MGTGLRGQKGRGLVGVLLAKEPLNPGPSGRVTPAPVVAAGRAP